MKFSVFLNKMQQMFQIYKQEGEEKPESAKIRFLLDRTQAPHLQQAVTNLRFQLNQGTLTYTSAKNSLMTEVIKSSDYAQNDGRNVSASGTGDHKDSSSKKSPHKKKGGLKTPPKGHEFIDDKTWKKLTHEQQQVIRKYRDDNGLPGGTKSVGAVSTTSSMSDADIQRIVSAIEARHASSSTTVSSVSGTNGDSPGQAFGGRAEATNRRVT
jgi:hypothetical protein